MFILRFFITFVGAFKVVYIFFSLILCVLCLTLLLVGIHINMCFSASGYFVIVTLYLQSICVINIFVSTL